MEEHPVTALLTFCCCSIWFFLTLFLLIIPESEHNAQWETIQCDVLFYETHTQANCYENCECYSYLSWYESLARDDMGALYDSCDNTLAYLDTVDLSDCAARGLWVEPDTYLNDRDEFWSAFDESSWNRNLNCTDHFPYCESTTPPCCEYFCSEYPCVECDYSSDGLSENCTVITPPCDCTCAVYNVGNSLCDIHCVGVYQIGVTYVEKKSADKYTDEYMLLEFDTHLEYADILSDVHANFMEGSEYLPCYINKERGTMEFDRDYVWSTPGYWSMIIIPVVFMICACQHLSFLCFHEVFDLNEWDDDDMKKLRCTVWWGWCGCAFPAILLTCLLVVDLDEVDTNGLLISMIVFTAIGWVALPYFMKEIFEGPSWMHNTAFCICILVPLCVLFPLLYYEDWNDDIKFTVSMITYSVLFVGLCWSRFAKKCQECLRKTHLVSQASHDRKVARRAERRKERQRKAEERRLAAIAAEEEKKRQRDLQLAQLRQMNESQSSGVNLKEVGLKIHSEDGLSTDIKEAQLSQEDLKV